jgi:hypothetical protein
MNDRHFFWIIVIKSITQIEKENKSGKEESDCVKFGSESTH